MKIRQWSHWLLSLFATESQLSHLLKTDFKLGCKKMCSRIVTNGSQPVSPPDFYLLFRLCTRKSKFQKCAIREFAREQIILIRKIAEKRIIWTSQWASQLSFWNLLLKISRYFFVNHKVLDYLVQKIEVFKNQN